MSLLMLLIGRLQLLFSDYEEVVRGLEMLALHHRASPQLVRPAVLYQEVGLLEKQLSRKGHRMLIKTEADIWKCETSYSCLLYTSPSPRDS